MIKNRAVCWILSIILMLMAAGTVASAQQVRQWTPTDKSAIDNRKFFESIPVCQTIPKNQVQVYGPSDFTHLARWKERAKRGEVELRNLEADACGRTPTAKGIQVVRFPEGAPVYFDKKTGKPLADGRCGNALFEFEYIPVPVTAIPPASAPPPAKPAQPATPPTAQQETPPPSAPPTPSVQIDHNIVNIDRRVHIDYRVTLPPAPKAEMKKPRRKWPYVVAAIGAGAIAGGVLATRGGLDKPPTAVPGGKP